MLCFSPYNPFLLFRSPKKSLPGLQGGQWDDPGCIVQGIEGHKKGGARNNRRPPGRLLKQENLEAPLPAQTYATFRPVVVPASGIVKVITVEDVHEVEPDGIIPRLP